LHLKNSCFLTICVVAFLCLCPQGIWQEALYRFWSPAISMSIYKMEYGLEKPVEMIMTSFAGSQLPIYEYSISYYGDAIAEMPAETEEEPRVETEDKRTLPDNLTDEGVSPEKAVQSLQHEEEREVGITENETPEIELPGKRLNDTESDFYIVDGNIPQQISYSKSILHTKKVRDIDLSQYYDEKKLIEDFYTIDPSTYLENGLSVEALLRKDMTMERNADMPQILIYHTHSQEGYSNSMQGSSNSSVVGAGTILADILREEYGYQVIHNMEQFDVQSRDYAYSYALPAVEKVLQDNPTIEVIIDLHRDAVADDRKLVTNIEGQDMAQFMFFNGLSFHKDIGHIDYLENPNLNENLAFSFQMQMACEEYYPGLARKIYLKSYRYNMHLRPKTLLVELGAQTNTFQEAVHSLAPLARCLHIVLSGELDKEI